MALPLQWTKRCKTDEDKDSVLFALKNNRILINALLEILEEMESEEDSLSTKDYDSPSWAYKQADRNGALRAIRKVKKLFDF